MSFGVIMGFFIKTSSFRMDSLRKDTAFLCLPGVPELFPLDETGIESASNKLSYSPLEDNILPRARASTVAT